MSNVHIKFIEDRNGDLIDTWYYHHCCVPNPSIMGWPCPEAVDYPVYCFECSGRIYEVPLTDEGKAACAAFHPTEDDYWTTWPL